MGRQRRTSTALEAALTRRANLAKISPTLDLGHGNTLATYDAELASVQTKLDAYNQTLAAADDALNQLQAAEKVLKNRSTKMLAGVGVAFGKDSSEYEMAGGTREGGR
jgi:ribosomal protein L27